MPFLLLNKPAGPTSHDMINKLRRITGLKKIGHAGTLDPFAEGLLLIAVGRESTREISKFVGLDKKYLTTLKLGATSDTQDRTGIITPCHPRDLPANACGIRRWQAGSGDPEYPLLKKEGRGEVNSPIGASGFRVTRPPCFARRSGREPGMTKADIIKILKKFTGPQDQLPPMFSAKQINGQRLYKLARQGKEIERPTHQINIYKIKLVKYLPAKNELLLEVSCSSGTYIRALAHDIGRSLGCDAYLEKLTRTEIGKYKIKKAVTLEKLTPENWEKYCF
jgi:tRNA pseudouridine55 synthase